MITIVSNAQNTITDTVETISPEIFNSATIPIIAPRLSATEDFNVLLSTENQSGFTKRYLLENYKGFINDSLNNTFKKTNDSIYEIQINNPSKGVLLVDNNINPDKYTIGINPIKLAAGLNSREIMGMNCNTISYKTGSSIIKYNVEPFNPFIDGIAYEIRDTKTDKLIRKFVFHYKFPKPILILATSNDTLIKYKKRDPSLAFGMVNDGFWKNEIAKSFNGKHNSVLFAFEHFARRLRSETDNIYYKLDSGTEWSSTALSSNPSILLENVPIGEHTLYAKYPSKDADILEYHFTIAPN